MNCPLVVTAAILPAESSLNHMRLSGPATIEPGWLPPVGMVYCVIAPLVVIAPMPCADPAFSVNHMRPSGPEAMPPGFVENPEEAESGTR